MFRSHTGVLLRVTWLPKGLRGTQPGFVTVTRFARQTIWPLAFLTESVATGEVRVDDVVVGIHFKLVVAVLVVGVPRP